MLAVNRGKPGSRMKCFAFRTGMDSRFSSLDIVLSDSMGLADRQEKKQQQGKEKEFKHMIHHAKNIEHYLSAGRKGGQAFFVYFFRLSPASGFPASSAYL